MNSIILGLLCGFYPLVFFYSNNFWAVNSWKHFGYFSLVFLGIPVAVFLLLNIIFKWVKIPKHQQLQVRFVSIIFVISCLMSQAISLKMEKKILLGILILAILLSFKLYQHWRKVIVLVLLMSVIPTVKCATKIVESQMQQWRFTTTDISEIAFKKTPNVYVIQPDGYVGFEWMSKEPYGYENPMETWLSDIGFSLYPNYRSNYPASLTSNAALFAMNHHYFGKTLAPSIELPMAREVIAGINPVIEAFSNNGYRNFFIVEDDYFQQNFPKEGYDYYNIPSADIPYFTDGNRIKKDVFEDLKYAMDTVSWEGPRFYFIEKLLPHHIHFAASKEEERETYLGKIRDVNIWLEGIVNTIEERDPDAIVVLLADHGGWVGLNSYDEMFSATDDMRINTVFSSLGAVKWNGHLQSDADLELKSSVNLFRVLFSVLSDNPELLKNTEDNSSYNLKPGSFSKSVRAVLDDNGNNQLQ